LGASRKLLKILQLASREIGEVRHWRMLYKNPVYGTMSLMGSCFIVDTLSNDDQGAPHFEAGKNQRESS
jgi:hypothetical protein